MPAKRGQRESMHRVVRKIETTFAAELFDGSVLQADAARADESVKLNAGGGLRFQPSDLREIDELR